MTSIDPKVLAARIMWVTALRDGSRTQGRGSLRNPDDTFCCLGVACDVVIGRDHSPLHRWVRVRSNTDHAQWSVPSGSKRMPTAKSSATLPEWAMEMYELPDDVGSIDSGYRDRDDRWLVLVLTKLNDGNYGMTDAWQEECIVQGIPFGETNVSNEATPQFTFAQIADIIEYLLVTPYLA